MRVLWYYNKNGAFLCQNVELYASCCKKVTYVAFVKCCIVINNHILVSTSQVEGTIITL